MKTGTPTTHNKTSSRSRGDKEEEEEEERGWKKGIQTTIDLIVRLEEDRQETMKKLEEEEERMRKLQLSLDEEAKKRMDLLESVVQAGMCGWEGEGERYREELGERRWKEGRGREI